MKEIKVIDTAITPDGVEIELHDLSGETRWPYYYNGLIVLGFCTIAKNTFPEDTGIHARKGEKYRSSIRTSNNYTKEMIFSDFEALKNGTKTLADLKEHFWMGKRDCYIILGS
jgi:hypothetical protein